MSFHRIHTSGGAVEQTKKFLISFAFRQRDELQSARLQLENGAPEPGGNVRERIRQMSCIAYCHRSSSSSFLRKLFIRAAWWRHGADAIHLRAAKTNIRPGEPCHRFNATRDFLKSLNSEQKVAARVKWMADVASWTVRQRKTWRCFIGNQTSCLQLWKIRQIH